MSATGGVDRDRSDLELKPGEFPEAPGRERSLIDPVFAAEIPLVEIGETVAPPAKPAVDRPKKSRRPAAAERRRLPQLDSRLAERMIVGLTTLVCFSQRPGQVFTDSRSDLTANPGLFLGRVFDVWSSTYDLGHVQSGQFVGYIFPMAPYYALGDAAGLPTWIVQRLWLALILSIGAIGVSRMIATFWRRDDALARLLGGMIFVLNPYVITQINRATITLLAYMVAPWLMVAAHRALLNPRSWRVPIITGLLVAAAGGGVNAAVLAWILLAPVLLILYEITVIGRSRRAAWSVLWRTGITVPLLSLWWLIPVTLQSKYGADFLSFTEQPVSIWQTNSASESIRLLGYWISYFTIGFGASRPVVPPTVGFLFEPILIAGSFAVPVLAFAGLSRIWRRPYVPFFVLLTAFATVAMSVGFPPGKPLYNLLVDAYYAFPLLQILRTTYKAGPLMALGLAFLAAAGGATLFRQARKGIPRRAIGAALVLTPVLFGWPLIAGTALDPEISYRSIPKYWTAATKDLAHDTRPGYRSMILPGQQFGFYKWGSTFDPIAPALSRTPTAQRYSVRYADPHSSQLMTAIDNLVQQRRLVPGQLRPLLRLIGVDELLIAADGKPESSGEIDPASAMTTFAIDGTLRKPTETYGPTSLIPPAVGRGGNAAPLPALRRYSLGTGDKSDPGLIRAHSRAGSVIVSGDANAVIELAALGLLPKQSAILYSGDQTPKSLRKLVDDGASLFITDTNRRQTVLASRTTHDQGAVLTDTAVIPPSLPSYDSLSGQSRTKETVATHTTIRYVTNPEGPQLLMRPEARPFAALDGNLATSWTPASFLPEERWMEVGLKRPIVMDSLRIHPHRDALLKTIGIAVSLNGGLEHRENLAGGWNSIRFPKQPVSRIRLRITNTATFGGIDLGGIDEIQIPGLKADEWLRTPVWLGSALVGMNLSRTPVGILLARQTTSDPYRQSGALGGPVPIGDPQATFDAELGIRRIVSVPVSRSFSPSGWASSAPWAPDPAFDRLTGLDPAWRFTGSPRFEGLPLNRASSAFDGDPHTNWIGEYRAGIKPWLAWKSPQTLTFDRIRLRPASPIYSRATQIRLHLGSLSTDVLPVSASGEIKLPEPVTTDQARIEIVDAATPEGIAALRLLPAVAIKDVEIPGIARPGIRRSGSFSTSCSELKINSDDGSVGARVSGSVFALDRGYPLRFETCGAGSRLPLFLGPNTITAPPGPVMRIDHLQLSSKAPMAPIPSVRTSVKSPNQGRDGFATVRFGGPGWLVRGESMSLGWRASCGPTKSDQRDLGPAQVVDGFAAGWPVDRWCREARFTFVPQKEANRAYAISGVATLICLGALLLTAIRSRRRRLSGVEPQKEPVAPMAPAVDRVAYARGGFAAAAPLLAGSVAAAIFALRVGPPAAIVALFLGLWGVNVRRLYLLAFTAIALVPLCYVAFTPKNGAGGNFFYAIELIGPHWLAAAGILLAGSGAMLTALRIRWSTHPRAGRVSIRKALRALRLRLGRSGGG